MNKSGKVAQAMPKLANAPLTLTNTLNARLKHSVYRQKSTAMGKSHFSQVNLNGGMKTKTKKTIKARFDPITKKYVPANVSLTQETVVSNSPPISNLKLSKTILKEQFTQSTLSIQNKVEQINSVLSSLNSAKLSSGGGTEKHFVHSLTTNGLLDRGSVEKCRLVQNALKFLESFPTITNSITLFSYFLIGLLQADSKTLCTHSLEVKKRHGSQFRTICYIYALSHEQHK